ncbi:MAG: J domain-containing protein [Deltaproteobacteria bacterium]|nr:J domain-containing protein [Deltaproteobacteria bacterium]
MSPENRPRSITALNGPRQTPEQRELAKKLAELGQLEATLAERELVLATLRAEMRAFYAQYVRVIGDRYARLDEIEAQIAEATARLNPQDAEAQRRASAARAKARKSAGRATAAKGSKRAAKFTPSDSLKKQYRDAAKHVHPDLASSDEERSRRQRVMGEINGAYEAADEDRLRKILRDWQDSPEAVVGEGPGADLIRTIRKIAQVERRLETIDATITALRAGYFYQLRAKTQDAKSKGVDLLAQMAAEADARIERAQQRLATMTAARAA